MIYILCGIVVGLLISLIKKMLEIAKLERENKHLNNMLDHALEEMEKAQLKLEGK